MRSISGCGGRDQELPRSFDAHEPRGGDGGGVEGFMAERKPVSQRQLENARKFTQLPNLEFHKSSPCMISDLTATR